ncbi:MAG TPA: triacylglycerol lipase [Polyangiaceae bacterium]|nr:triacylglycerol lipase [Polyangiaceae bacterium]
MAPLVVARSLVLAVLTGVAGCCAVRDKAATVFSDGGGVDAARDGDPLASPEAPWESVPWLATPVSGSDPGPPYPIVLHHGFSGWKEVKRLRVHYFHEVADALAVDGETMVFETVVEPYAPTEQRAAQLARQVDRILIATGKARVNLVAHSQGGLDSRYLVSTLGYGARVASLTTISTPHRGTAIADALSDDVPNWGDPIANAVADVIGRTILDVESDSDLRGSLESLSESAMEDSFNPQNPDDPAVDYFSYAGRSNGATGEPDCDGSWLGNEETRLDRVDPMLKVTGAYLRARGRQAGENDGVVTVRSARWGLFMGCFPADHFDEIGQIAKSGANAESGFDHREFYRDVVRRLRERGY